ncbi:MAG: SRPBCC family protein [Acidobacteria bacterium]|nr:SRPBCC family protein [Acidobacteriota bacterium]
MAEQSVVHSTFVIERSFPVSPERVFAAFADTAKKRRWFGEGDHHEVEVFEMDFREGGAERASYRFKEGTPFAGVVMASEGTYLDIVPGQRVVSASTMSFGGKRISAALVTVELLQTDKGTDLICTHQGSFFEGADGPERREAGWRKLFERLAAALGQ